MRRYLLFCALGALLGCRTVSEPSSTAIALFCSTSEQSKTDILTQGEEIAVFARIEGTASYFLEAVKFTVKADGHSLTTAPAVAYPETNQAIHFFAYFPYHTGIFSVPTDQSQPEALKQADLRGATASTTPVATPVALEFRHLMARVVVTIKEPTTKISFPNAVASGVVHAATAELVLADTRSEVWTTGNELIVPVQPLSRLVLTVSGVEYVFDTAPIALQAGQTTTLDLTLHPDTHTATLSESSITDWGSVNGEGNPSQVVSNTLTVHWLPNAHYLSAVVDRIVCTINGADYTVSNGIVYANDTFTVPFASEALRYPYTITKITFYQSSKLVQSCTNLLGGAIYKSGALTIGIKDVPINWVKVGNLWWATGNLVASNATAGARGEGGCRIGAPADGGLYFQFGSLIGWKGGALDNGGTGVGMPLAANGTYWGGAAMWSWGNEAMVWPSAMITTPTVWPANYGSTAGDRNTVVNQWFFNYNTAPYSNPGQDIRGFATSFSGDAGSGTLATGRYAKWGIGDPCTYYLGGTWRLPTTLELASITGVTGGDWIAWTTAEVTGCWATAAQTFDEVSGPGAWFGASLKAGVGLPSISVNPFFPASGHRYYSIGSFNTVTTHGYGWSSSVGTATGGHYLSAQELKGVFPQGNSSRSYGFSVRCVSSVAP